MDSRLLINMTADKGSEYVVIPRNTLGTILDIAYESISDQGPIAIRLFEQLLKELEHKIIPYENFERVEYTVLVSGSAIGTPNNIQLIKKIREMTSLGLKEAKKLTDEIITGTIYTYVKTDSATKMLEAVAFIRGLGYHVLVYKGDQVIFNSKNDDDINGLMLQIPTPTV